MWVIKRVQVKNFRSIIEGEFKPLNLSVIVGQNDVGKSNYLRALNLFFNEETDVGVSFDFASDFSKHAVVGKGKAKQIEVILDIHPPPWFADSSPIRWRKIWREEGKTYYIEEIYRLPGKKEIASKSKVRQWLKRIKFRYVPAIKGSEYFTSLLRALHDTLAEAVDERLRNASTDFITVIRSQTKAITGYVSESLNIKSELQLPENLRSLFEVLDFSTSDSGNNLSLRLRGDGVKVRHIPAILKFLAEQDHSLAVPGKPKPTTIWGYEEPENNLELKKAFDHANEILQAISVVQIIVTTHSPALYSLALTDNVEVGAFAAQADSQRGTQLTLVDSKSVKDFDSVLGYMPVIAPYLIEKVKQLAIINDELDQIKQSIKKQGRPLILVGGETDVTYISKALEVFNPITYSLADVKCVGMAGANGSKGAGDGKMKSLALHYQYCPELIGRKTVLLFDCDAEVPEINAVPNLKIIQLKHDPANKRAKKGVENLLPESVFLESFYSSTTKNTEYGGTVITTTLNKVALAKSVCKGHEVLDLLDNVESRLSGFKEAANDISLFLSSE